MTATVTTAVNAAEASAEQAAGERWIGFAGRHWRETIDARDFIQANYTPYAGDGSFLTGPTARTTALWARLEAMFPIEREHGIYDVDGLPFHKLAAAKYAGLGIPFPLAATAPPTERQAREAREHFAAEGLATF